MKTPKDFEEKWKIESMKQNPSLIKVVAKHMSSQMWVVALLSYFG